MTNDIKMIHEDLLRLRRDVELIKKVLLHEGKLTSWAKKALAEARAEKEENYISISSL
ncbi:MAG: hypothetical protein AABX85_04675 [Nanoarchaeota archaeon]